MKKELQTSVESLDVNTNVALIDDDDDRLEDTLLQIDKDLIQE